MLFGRTLRDSIETIHIYYKHEDDLIIIGSFNDPHGPRKECGHPVCFQEKTSAEELGLAIQETYHSCLKFTQKDLLQPVAPYTQATGEKSWSKFAKRRGVIHIEWHKNGTIHLEQWNWLPDGGFGPDAANPTCRTISAENQAYELGNAVLSMIKGNHETNSRLSKEF